MTQMAHDLHCVALRQLETALRLYFEREDYYSVITLAGVSEEVFGKLLKEGNPQNALDSLKKDVPAVHKALFDEDLAEREVSERANWVRNLLKHWSPGQPKVVEFDAPEEAKDMLDRAISNYFQLTGNPTSAMQQFKDMHVQDNPQIHPRRKDNEESCS